MFTFFYLYRLIKMKKLSKNIFVFNNENNYSNVFVAIYSVFKTINYTLFV